MAEYFPFSSGAEHGSDDDPELDLDDEKEKKEDESPKKSIFSKEKGDNETSSDRETEPREEKGFFEELFRKDQDTEDESATKEVKSPQDTVEQMRKIVQEKLQENSTNPDVNSVETQEEFLESVDARLKNQETPKKAVDQSLEDSVERLTNDSSNQESEEKLIPDTQTLDNNIEYDRSVTESVESGAVDLRHDGTERPTKIDDAIEAKPIDLDINNEHQTITNNSENKEPSSYESEVSTPLSLDNETEARIGPELFSASAEDPFEQNSTSKHESPPQEKDTVPMNDFYRRERSTGRVFLGAGLGYLLGKKRGRKKAKKELNPTIARQKSVIDNYKKDLERAQHDVEKVTNRIQEQPIVLKRTIENKFIKSRQEINEAAIASKADKKESKSSPAQTIINKIDNNTDKLISKIAIDKPKRSSSIDKVPDKETKSIKNRETIDIERKNLEVELPRSVKTMTLQELLDVADKIEIEDLNLKELYQNKRIDSVNLRRVIIEYMKGGDRYQSLLRNSLQAVELQGDIRHETLQKRVPAKNIHNSQEAISSDDGASSIGSLLSIRQNDSRLSIANNDKVGKSDLQKEAIKSKQLIENSTEIPISTAILAGSFAGILLMIAVLIYSAIF